MFLSMPLFPRRPRRPESYYRSRREDFAAGLAITGGIFAALLRAVHQWLLIVRGVRRLDPAHGLLAFMWVVGKAACLGAAVGFAAGWLLGFLWERWHRRRRARRRMEEAS
jgi:membrane associated rhomboid family serine protease